MRMLWSAHQDYDQINKCICKEVTAPTAAKLWEAHKNGSIMFNMRLENIHDALVRNSDQIEVLEVKGKTNQNDMN